MIRLSIPRHKFSCGGLTENRRLAERGNLLQELQARTFGIAIFQIGPTPRGRRHVEKCSWELFEVWYITSLHRFDFFVLQHRASSSELGFQSVVEFRGAYLAMTWIEVRRITGHYDNR